MGDTACPKQRSPAIGPAGAVHPNMPGDIADLFRSISESTTEISRVLEFERKNFSSFLRSEEDSRAARSFVKRNGLGLTLLFNASIRSLGDLVGFGACDKRDSSIQLVLLNQDARLHCCELPHILRHQLYVVFRHGGR